MATVMPHGVLFRGGEEGRIRRKLIENDHLEAIPEYSAVVPVAEILSPANDCSLNIRRYADNSPPPEPHDVRAHLHGGVPQAEVDTLAPLFSAHGFDPA